LCSASKPCQLPVWSRRCLAKKFVWAKSVGRCYDTNETSGDNFKPKVISKLRDWTELEAQLIERTSLKICQNVFFAHKINEMFYCSRSSDFRNELVADGRQFLVLLHLLLHASLKTCGLHLRLLQHGRQSRDLSVLKGL